MIVLKKHNMVKPIIAGVVIFLSVLQPAAQAEEVINIVFLVDSLQYDVPRIVSNVLRDLQYTENAKPIKMTDHFITVDRYNLNQSMHELCKQFYEGISIVLDLTKFEWDEGTVLIKSSDLSYIKLDASIAPFLEAFEAVIHKRDGNDALLIFQSDHELEEGLNFIVRKSRLRVLPMNGLANNFVQRLESLRPQPGYYGIFANTENMRIILEKVSESKLLKCPDKWNLIFLDFATNDFKTKSCLNNITLIRGNGNKLCMLLQNNDCTSSEMSPIVEMVFTEILRIIAAASESLPRRQVDCSDDTNTLDAIPRKSTNFDLQFAETIKKNKILKLDGTEVTYRLNLLIDRIENGSNVEAGEWDDGVLSSTRNDSIKPAKRFFRIGTTEAIPWSYIVRDPLTQETILDNDGNPMWNGYCIDLIAKIAEIMSFDYEIVPPRKGTFGNRLPSGQWDGLIGDLITEEIDIAVAALKMTAEREEVIDFVAPYFVETGIAIVIRKPARQTSLFKFMTVLRLEVWLSIVAALISTALMIWFLDRYSPYSARNNSKAYPYNCRDFTLKESFWFALTSFTPQGGGEVPKSISARTLVAAYWLFVVLMLATFTANLAAFLTVERMQTPVQSLEQLARQSRINYTVVEGSDTHKYFINMKFAEDTLYRLWKELTLNATSDQSQYRVWEYPIKEQYGHIVLAINSSNPVKTAAEGFRLVDEHENADFAFIHDAAEIKYEISKNCNLTEIGEVFAEQPYAVAVQQGSHLQDEVTLAILELQKNRYFEALTAKYWNNSAQKDCSSSDETEGITLQSLGGVFIATLFGLGLAMITLVCEVIYYKRKRLRGVVKVQPIESNNTKSKGTKDAVKVSTLPTYSEIENDFKDGANFQVTLTKEFAPARRRNAKITYISPREPIEGPYYYE